ncbi:hypothetical protein XM38_002080 [Halomicronema hongdechloris C2206]|uniref:Metal-binding protein n=1 Tax=Halomicronema hongdechloris C2206 TaxID=1641165 RepID=A0A1Z3HG89_9CYAN|nr:DUF2103 domain-containing protein [Halomicronema hongdechloris]ASC69281.1 hypothetical protein XM38_002080 [Halomicronema hongdechloris C2206]
MGKSSDGRLVWNHSTHLPGLIPILERLVAYPGIRTVTPGEIAKVRGHSPTLRIKVSVPIRGGYKLIARRGKTVQEVFVITEQDKAGLETTLAEIVAQVT